MKPLLASLAIFFVCHYSLIAQNDTLNIYYDIGQYKLNNDKVNLLKKFLIEKDSAAYNVEIISSTDEIGTAESNFLLSKRRANYIKNILNTSHKHYFKNIKTRSIGEVANSTDFEKENAKNRKTTLVFKRIKNSILNPKYQKKGKTIQLKNLEFFPGKAKLVKKSNEILEDLVICLQINPSMKIEISGHVCCESNIPRQKGKEPVTYHGNELSTRRAKAIYDFLVARNINPDRLSYIGYGFQKPLVYPERSVADMQRNKRVEITITDL